MSAWWLLVCSVLVARYEAYGCFCGLCRIASIGTCCQTDCICTCENHGLYACDEAEPDSCAAHENTKCGTKLMSHDGEASGVALTCCFKQDPDSKGGSSLFYDVPTNEFTNEISRVNLYLVGVIILCFICNIVLFRYYCRWSTARRAKHYRFSAIPESETEDEATEDGI